MMGAGEAERKGLRGPSGAGAGPHAALAPGGGGEKGAALTPAVTSARVQETLDVVQSHFGLPTCLAYTVFKMFN